MIIVGSLVLLLGSPALNYQNRPPQFYDTVFRLVIIGISFVRYKRQMIEFLIHAFILIGVSRVRPFTKPEFARIFVSRYLSILEMKYFWTFEL